MTTCVTPPRIKICAVSGVGRRTDTKAACLQRNYTVTRSADEPYTCRQSLWCHTAEVLDTMVVISMARWVDVYGAEGPLLSRPRFGYWWH